VPQDAWQRPPLTIAALLQPGQKVHPHLMLPQVSPAGWVSWQDAGWLVMAGGTRVAGSPCKVGTVRDTGGLMLVPGCDVLT
jgi:hypothetical protein